MVASQPSIEQEPAMALPVVTYKNCRDNAPRQSFREWPALRGGLVRHTPRPFKDGPAWSPAEYLPDQPRGNANVQAVSCFVADIDDGTPPADLRGRWLTPGGSPLAFALHSSYSSTPDHPKYRVIFPLQAPVPASDWPAVHRKLTLALMGDHADPACKDASRLYYLPACPPEALETAFADMQEGEPIDPGDFADPPPEEVAEAQMRRAFRSAPPLSAGFENVSGNKPGDDFNLRGDVLALLLSHGWQEVGGRGGMVLLRRPGKGDDHSATFGYDGTRMFYCFSSSAAPFEANTGYSPFGAYALLEHRGDFREAAKKLGEDGYGEQFTQGIDIRTKPGFAAHCQGQGAGTHNVPHQPGSAWEPPVSFAAHSLPPFPVEALPSVLAAYVGEVAASSQVPVDMAGMIGLGIIAVAAGRRCIVQIGRTHSEPTNLFCAVVMEPGSRKSQTVDAFAFPLREYEAALAQSARAEIAAADAVHGIEVKRLEHLQNTAAKAKAQDERDTLTREAGELAAQMTTVPTLPHLLADNVTPEALSSIMADNGGACAIISPEGGIFSILAGRYTDKQVDLDLVLKSHAGDEVRVDRKSRASEFIKHPALSLVLAVQPDVLGSLSDTPSFRGRGLLGRFLYSLPESLAGTRKYQDRPVDAVARARYGHAIEQILSLPDAGTEEDPTARHSLSLTGDALALWAAFADEVEARQAEGGDLAGIRDWGSKLGGQVARIAAGFHLFEKAGGNWQSPISPEAVAAAWTVGQYLVFHAQAAFGQMSADPRLALARRILRWIGRTLTPDTQTGEATFTLRECQRAHTGTGHTAAGEDVQAALLLLAEREFIRPASARQETGGRPGSAAYAVNPAVFGGGQPGTEKA